ncbi:myeloid leukemia factor 2-like isoform X1 [Paramacrobiotus metropolitanus]|uniref:myeloid leukemia factor 2-like isoform X1 n=2 Tax=Paramacrobiotus metropolitanus TaxID=2943436 RepID=UPI002446403B|nr:myeloid leukemia factor 2-like isoform X1 [Paramacrobiotus metropolitanus]
MPSMDHSQVATPGNLDIATFPLSVRASDNHFSRLQRSQSVKVKDIVPVGFQDDFMATFERMDAMFDEIDNIMRNSVRKQNVLAHTYSATSVMTYVNNGNGPPKIYQASSSTCSAPGGIRQTRKIIRDSHSGIEKVTNGFHIGDRARLTERSRNHRTGQQDEEVEFINMNEEDAVAFQNEWRRKTCSASTDLRNRYQKQPVHNEKLPFSEAFANSNPYHKLPALTYKPGDDAMQKRKPTSM